jgi:hypothetical protein
MNRKERRRAHLLAHLDRYEKDTDCLKAINEKLASHPEYEQLSESYFSQLKGGKRNIGDAVVGKLEYGLCLRDGALDFPLPDEVQQIIDSGGADATLEAALSIMDGSSDIETITIIADRASPKAAISYAKLLLDRAETGL